MPSATLQFRKAHDLNLVQVERSLCRVTGSCVSGPHTLQKPVNGLCLRDALHHSLFEFLWTVLANYGTPERGHGNLWFAAKLEDITVNLGTHYSWLVSEVGGGTGGMDPWTSGVCTNSESCWKWIVAYLAGVAENCLTCEKPMHVVLEVKCDSSDGAQEKHKCVFPRSLLFITVHCSGLWTFISSSIKHESSRTSLVVQWLRLRAPKTGGPGIIPGWGSRTCMLPLSPGTVN